MVWHGANALIHTCILFFPTPKSATSAQTWTPLTQHAHIPRTAESSCAASLKKCTTKKPVLQHTHSQPPKQQPLSQKTNTSAPACTSLERHLFWLRRRALLLQQTDWREQLDKTQGRSILILRLFIHIHIEILASSVRSQSSHPRNPCFAGLDTGGRGAWADPAKSRHGGADERGGDQATTHL